LLNGTFRTDTTTAPTRVKRDGSWTPVDYTLIDTGKGISPKASSVGVSFSSGGNGSVVTLTENGKSIDMAWAARVPRLTLNGPRATYDLGDSTLLVLAATSDGFERSLILATPPTTAPQLPLGFNPKCLTGNAEGGYDFHAPAPTGAAERGTGAVKDPQRLHDAGPVMYSAARDKVVEEHIQVQAVTTKLGKAVHGVPGAGSVRRRCRS
jgi:hypothetical protein